MKKNPNPGKSKESGITMKEVGEYIESHYAEELSFLRALKSNEGFITLLATLRPNPHIEGHDQVKAGDQNISNMIEDKKEVLAPIIQSNSLNLAQPEKAEGTIEQHEIKEAPSKHPPKESKDPKKNKAEKKDKGGPKKKPDTTITSGRKEAKEEKSLKENKEHKDYKDLKESKEHKNIKNSKVQKEQKEQKESKETNDSKEPEALSQNANENKKEGEDEKGKEVSQKNENENIKENAKATQEPENKNILIPNEDLNELNIENKNTEVKKEESIKKEEKKTPKKEDKKRRANTPKSFLNRKLEG